MRKKKEKNHIDIFQSSIYQKHNIARLSHLNSLALELNNKSVIEFGAGIGDHTIFYLHKNCKVLATDARTELLEVLKSRFEIETRKLDVEVDISEIGKLPFVDIIHCYGLLYHISNPSEFLKEISSKSDLLLLETCVSWDGTSVEPHLISEDLSNPTQAASGVGCRPNRNWLTNELRKYYKYVYYPKTQPNHIEFPLDWENENRTQDLIRAIFIASNSILNNPNLTETMPTKYESMP